MSDSPKQQNETAQSNPVKLVIRKLDRLETTKVSTSPGT
jgi:hypothetical protein